MKPESRRTLILVAMVSVWLVMSACSCGDTLRQAIGLVTSEEPMQTPVPEAAPASKPTATATLLVPTRAPATSQSIEIPSEPGAAFRLELSEEQINTYLADQTFDEVGVQASEITVTLLETALVCEGRVHHDETGLAASLTVRGKPSVVDGQIYFLVEDVELGESLKGFTRLIAKGMLNEAIEQYSSPDGIPVPMDDIVWDEIQLGQGWLVLAGRRAE